jgi:hypothetical protein
MAYKDILPVFLGENINVYQALYVDNLYVDNKRQERTNDQCFGLSFIDKESTRSE